MKIAFFDTHRFEKDIFSKTNINFNHEITFFEARLKESTYNLAHGFPCVCVFVNDVLNQKVLKYLVDGGTQLIALRCAGFNNVDLSYAKNLNLKLVRVPEYSPYAVAEYAVALILTMNRKIHRAYNRVKEGNFSLDGLVGFDLHMKTVGIVGTGRIGSVLAKILLGFGCKVIAVDSVENSELKKLGVEYASLEFLLKHSDIISLNVPLNPNTKYILNETSLSLTKPGVMIVNTGRGGLIETRSLIQFLKSGHIGFAGLDVYEEEAIFFEDHSQDILQDDQLARLLTFPNVLLTSHQAFLTQEALQNIAHITLQNVSDFAQVRTLLNGL